MIFESWTGIVRVVLSGILAYFALLLLLRVSGKRTLSKMNAFDFVVTVALGSILASVTVSKDVPVAEGAAAFGLLIGLQFAITWLSVRVPFVRQIVKSEPTLLFHNGEFISQAMRRERITESEVRAAVRNQGLLAMDGVFGVVLETDGSMTVLPMPNTTSPIATAMSSVANFPPPGA